MDIAPIVCWSEQAQPNRAPILFSMENLKRGNRCGYILLEIGTEFMTLVFHTAPANLPVVPGTRYLSWEAGRFLLIPNASKFGSHDTINYYWALNFKTPIALCENKGIITESEQDGDLSLCLSRYLLNSRELSVLTNRYLLRESLEGWNLRLISHFSVTILFPKAVLSI